MSSVLAAWGAVLDRSIEQMAAASGDARTFDRRLIVKVSDVWDNNTFPFFAAAAARSSRRREQLARDGFGWMADFGSARRAWVIEQAAAAGYPMDLPPLSRDYNQNWRDYRGVVRPAQVPLTAEAAAELRVDYDLGTAKLQYLSVERSNGLLHGNVVFTLDRRFDTDWEGCPPAELDLRFESLGELRFDIDDSGGIGIDCRDQDVSTTIGGNGLIRASHGTAWIHDSRWNLSVAGQAAGARTPAETPRSEPGQRGHVTGAPALAASLLRRAMLEIRMVRYPSWAHRVAVHELCLAFSGVGEAVTAAGAVRLKRSAAFRRLIEQWIDAGGEILAPWFRRELGSIADAEYESAEVRELAGGLIGRVARSAATPARWRAAELPPESELLLVEFSVGRPPHDSSVVVQLASPPEHDGGSWVRRGLEVEKPQRFRLDLAAFRGSTGIRVGQRSEVEAVVLRDDNLAVSSAGR
jgi:hypothetical protein